MSTPRAADTPLRILFVSDTGAQLGGAERSLLDLVERLDPTRYERHVVLAEDGRFATLLREAGVQVVILPLGTIARTRNPFKLALYSLRLSSGVLRLWRLIRTRRIHVVHVNKNPLALHAIPAAWLAGVACVWHVRNPVSRFGRLGRWLVGHCDQIIAVSNSVAEPFRKAFPECATRIAVVPEGIEAVRYDNPEAGRAFRHTIGADPGDQLVGTIGRLTPWKGQDDFVRAAALLAPRQPRARFLVVGDCLSSPSEAAADQAYRARLHSLADQLGVAGRLTFAGFREDVPAVMNALDIFVLPSHAEPFGIVLLEAMAAGRPIVATAAGGVPEIVRDGREALLVPPRDPAALAAAIERLLTDPALAACLGSAARQRVVAEFPIWRPAALVRQVYSKIAGETP